MAETAIKRDVGQISQRLGKTKRRQYKILFSWKQVFMHPSLAEALIQPFNNACGALAHTHTHGDQAIFLPSYRQLVQNLDG